MTLNDLELQLFERVLNIELGVPVQAELDYEGSVMKAIIIPDISPEGHFELKYFNAIAGDSVADGVGMEELFGIDAPLRKAWDQQGTVGVRLIVPESQFQRTTAPYLQTEVLHADPDHRGSLTIQENQVQKSTDPLISARFCIVGFPDFETPEKQWDAIGPAYSFGLPELDLLRNNLGDGAKITVSPPSHFIVLETPNGWKVTLTKDETPTRGEVSHTGVVEKQDGGAFSSTELKGILNALRDFCAFIAGAFCHPTVVIGYDRNQERTWGQIGRYKSPTTRGNTWFRNNRNPSRGAFLEWLFRNFWAKWISKADEIADVIESYVHSNAMREVGVPNDALAKSYSGLEIVASLSLGKTISGDPAKKIHQALESNRIPNRLLQPGSAATLHRLAGNLGINTGRGADLLNDVRNYVIHPLERRTASVIKRAHLNYVDANWFNYVHLTDLSQFYLEYLFLAYCGFNPEDPEKRCRDLLEDTWR